MKRKIIAIALLLGLLTSACGGEATSMPAQPVNSAPNAWIDSPLEGSTFPVGKIEIVSHTASLDGIALVELSVNGQIIRTDKNPDPSLSLFVIGQTWVPSAPGTYLVQVRGQSNSGEWTPYASINITVTGVTATFRVISSITPTGTPAFTPTPAAPPTLTLIKNAFCRKGPNEAFPELTAIPAGDTVSIEGISQDGFWYFVFWERFNARCWVAAASGETKGDLAGVEMLASPTLPPPTSIVPAAPACTLTCPSGCEPNPSCTACQGIGGGSCKP